jgi:hypothetical protein
MAMKWLRNLLGALVALVILFEEWGWEPLQRLMARIGRLPALAWIERRIETLSPHAALVVFVIPALALLPVKLGALWLIGQGHRWLGVALIIGAKVLGTAIVARLFALTRPALMSMPWFASVYGRWSAWKDELLLRVRASWAWRTGRAVRRLASRRWRAWRQT